MLLKNPMLLGQSYEAQLLPMCEATQAWRVHGVCMACAWRVHGVCMACAAHLSVANLKSDVGVGIHLYVHYDRRG